MPRLFLTGELSWDPAGRDELVAAGVMVETVPGAGHDIMSNNAEAFVAAVSRDQSQ